MEVFRVEIFCCYVNGCLKEYTSKYNLLRHVKINHLQAKAGNCDICGRKFVSIDNLKEHRYIHLDVKPYSCDLCEKTYRNKCMMVRHKRSHFFESNKGCDSRDKVYNYLISNNF